MWITVFARLDHRPAGLYSGEFCFLTRTEC